MSQQFISFPHLYVFSLIRFCNTKYLKEFTISRKFLYFAISGLSTSRCKMGYNYEGIVRVSQITALRQEEFYFKAVLLKLVM